jgi:lauroyl/myristoyl acyltransferase
MRDATPTADRRSNSQAASRRWLVAWTLVRRLPEPLAYALGGVGGRVYHRLDRDRQAALEANLAQVLGPAEAGLWVLAAGTAITVVQRILVVWQQSDVGPDIGR